jgi:hypothetical protein
MALAILLRVVSGVKYRSEAQLISRTQFKQLPHSALGLLANTFCNEFEYLMS